MRNKNKKCQQCEGENEDWYGHFKIKFSKSFKKEYGKKGMPKAPYCLNCIYDFLSGGLMSMYPEYIKSFKRINWKKIKDWFDEKNGD